MDRQIPDVWNIFSLSGPDYSQQRAAQQQSNYPYFHVNWSNNHQALLHKWCDRSSPCDRPRTYDKFYHKLPGNFVDNKIEKGRHLQCSSDVEELDLEVNCENPGGISRRKKRRKKSERNYSRTITEREVRHLDRHLSMKKTIRKKIMRDLQQAFVDMKDETPENMDKLNFDPKKKANNDAKLLDLLKGPDDNPSDSGHGTDPGPSPSQSDHQMHRASSKSVRTHQSSNRYLISDSSSCGGYESAESDKDIVILASEQIQALEISETRGHHRSHGQLGHVRYQRQPHQQQQQQQHHVPIRIQSGTNFVSSPNQGMPMAPPSEEAPNSSKGTSKKKSFWQLLTGKKSSSKKNAS